MEDTFDYTAPFATPSPAVSSTEPRKLAIRFTGSGSEYFRIWIVNLLLILVTLGIYYPWAKVRKLRYFYGNTVVDGEALGFHADAKKMFKGYALVAVLFACYSLAINFSPFAALVALIAMAAIWPTLFRSSLNFRLANTSWRGLRFTFIGTTQDAYKALLPLFGSGALVVALANLHDEAPVPPTWLTLAHSGMLLVSLALTPWLFQRIKAYQHNHYGLGPEQTTFLAGTWRFYVPSLKYIGAVVLVLALLLGSPQVISATGASKYWYVVYAVLGVPLMLVAYPLLYAYGTSRFQNLVWNHTASQHLQFHSELTLKPLTFLCLKNFFLMLITLGLYWPFASVALNRMRLECVTITSSIDVAQLASDGISRDGPATGEAAGDFLGIDLGL